MQSSGCPDAIGSLPFCHLLSTLFILQRFFKKKPHSIARFFIKRTTKQICAGLWRNIILLSIYERLKIAFEASAFDTRPLDFSKKDDFFLLQTLDEIEGNSLLRSSLTDPLKQETLLPGSSKFYGQLAVLSPDERQILTAIDPDGSELLHLCLLDTLPSVKETEDMQGRIFTEIKPHRILWFSWSPDGKNILYAGSREKNCHVSRIANDVKATPEVVLDDIHGVLWSEWGHPKFAFVQGARPGGMRDGLLTVFNPTSAEVLSEISTLISFWFFQKWNPERPLVPLLQPSGDFGKLSLYNAESGELREIPQPDGEIAQCIWSQDGEKLFQRSMREGRSVVHEINIDENSLRMLDLPVGTNTPYYAREWNGKQTLFFAHSDAVAANELWVHNLETGLNEKLTQWRSAAIGTEDFPVVESKSITYKSLFDGTTIHGFLFLPSESPPPGGYPCLAYIHGGPMYHYSDEFNGIFQVFTQEGFAIFAPNFRGSTGYGPAFMKSLFQEAGRADLQDVSSGVDHVVENFDINPKRVGITGASYGGFMTLAALAFQPERWVAGYASVPVADWTYMADHGDAIYKEFIEYMWGDVEKNRPLMLERSPISKVDDVRAPLGISQGANDSRTPFPPVLEFANRLYARSHTLELHITPDSGHLTIRKDEIIRDYAGRVAFLKTHLTSKE